MLDLSNNNSFVTISGFRSAHVKGGHTRVYLKAIEGTKFHDRTYPFLKRNAETAGFKVGAYNFLHPLDATPQEIATAFERYIGAQRKNHELRPCIDCEYGRPGVKVGKWITELADLLHEHYGYAPLVYGSGWWLHACAFEKAPGPLWLAAYGRDDGREYPVGSLPYPWRTMAAHQYSSRGDVVGIGRCDVSHVFVPASIDIPKEKVG